MANYSNLAKNGVWCRNVKDGHFNQMQRFAVKSGDRYFVVHKEVSLEVLQTPL